VAANPWVAEGGRALGIVLVGAAAGALAGRPLAGAEVGALGYLAWVLVQLARMERWLRVGKKRYPPPTTGIWAEIYRHVQRVQERARRRKRKLSNFVKRFRESAAALPDGAVILDAAGDILWLNAAASRLLGLRMPGDVGQPIGNLVRHPAFLEFIRQPGESGAVEFPSPESTGVLLSVSLIRYGKDERLLLARDVSELARVEQIRRDFVANVSHELRTPLTVITGYLETLLDSADELPPPWRRSLQSMSEQAARMGRLLEDLLLLARLESAQEPAVGEEPVAVPALLAAVEEDARVRSAGRHRITSEVDTTLWLRGEGDRLRSVFGNLVQNALQYTPEGGQIGLRWHRDESGAHFTVRDTGIGVAPQHISRLTERFYRVDVGRSRDRGGTGLGLAIVKHVLSRHGAVLRVESVLGEGSTFTCDFPAGRVLVRTPEARLPARVAAVAS
jgi:two-component system phosphate regulon sensor histidine kinase PhoR